VYYVKYMYVNPKKTRVRVNPPFSPLMVKRTKEVEEVVSPRSFPAFRVVAAVPFAATSSNALERSLRANQTGAVDLGPYSSLRASHGHAIYM
jgi:hypothetical protein